MLARPALPLVLGALVLLALPARAQTLELVDTAFFPTSFFDLGGSDVWGYTAPDGTEYALFGVRDGIAVVQVPSMDVIGIVPGPEDGDFYYHRDIVVHGDYAYAVSECYGLNEGLQVIDLSGLPASISLVNVHTAGVTSSHNLDVDGGTGWLYALDSGASGVYFIDASDPLDLVNAHYLDLPSVHDVHARNDTLWVAEGSSPTFSVWDVSTKTNPQMLSRTTIPASGYVHNIWPTDDGRYALTTEETDFKTVKVWDVSDMNDVELVGQYLGPNGLAHNVHVQGDYAFISHYESGVVVLDLTDKANPTEVARYDTYPSGEGPNFNGSWGATVPSPSGYVYGGDFDGKLTVLRWTPPTTAVSPEIDAVGGPITIPAAGGSFDYTARVTNTSSSPQTFDAWVTATLPNGSERPVVGPVAVTLPAGGSAQRTLTLTVPGAAPAGLYTVSLHVGDHPSGIDATDSFTFTKEADAARPGGPDALRMEGAFFDAADAPAAHDAREGAMSVSPNPARARSTVRFTLGATAPVRLSVLDALGREVVVLAEGTLGAGSHAYAFERAGLPAGLYLARLVIDGRVQTQRLTVVR